MYLVLINSGCEGWSVSTPIKTLEQAIDYVTVTSYGNPYKIVKEVDYTITEIN